MKIAVTIKTTRQVTECEWARFRETKLFDETSTFHDVDKWLKSVDLSHTISDAEFNLISENKPVDSSKKINPDDLPF